jgi:hypothetical protein
METNARGCSIHRLPSSYSVRFSALVRRLEQMRRRHSGTEAIVLLDKLEWQNGLFLKRPKELE